MFRRKMVKFKLLFHGQKWLRGSCHTWRAMRLFFPRWMRFEATAAMQGDRTILATLLQDSFIEGGVGRKKPGFHCGPNQPFEDPCSSFSAEDRASNCLKTLQIHPIQYYSYLHLLPNRGAAVAVLPNVVHVPFLSQAQHVKIPSVPSNPGVAYTTSGRLTEAGGRDVLTEKHLGEIC